MLSLANQFVARASRLILSASVAAEPALWTVSVHGRVVGAMVCRDGVRRLSWFDGADPRLASFAGPLDGDVEALAEVLGARVGAPIAIDAQPL